MAPELLYFKRGANPSYTVAADMWSLGAICVRLLTGGPAFDLRELVEYYCHEGAFVPEDALASKETSQDGRDFIRKLMARVPLDRLSAHEATKHNWITSNPRPPPGASRPV
jgi:serine/threonine protein kinase